MEVLAKIAILNQKEKGAGSAFGEAGTFSGAVGAAGQPLYRRA
jgi:hypothetical protein